MRCRLIRFNSPWHPLPTTHVDDRVSLIYKERAVQVPSDPDQGDQSSTKIELVEGRNERLKLDRDLPP